MSAIDYVVMAFATVLVLGAYGYTFIVQRDTSSLDRAWTKTAETMRITRDDQVSRLRGDMTTAISELSVRLYDHKLYTQREYATNESVDRMRDEMLARFDKLDDKMDTLSSLVKQRP